ncbi:EscU/YscU/HrcU family type III secretion system export apparatus switch protein [Aeribacillus composti]|uniref:EscU/YscU/HrcU family type III secretion system export apparatus switch protein n=1 Tax=Aeribacillus composti TaxID=1868734 RepID=UPI002E21BB6E|nr:EscU/YscU/HrcU family type III secretion system export apparatus switch protein [Aeribacillus composti]
MKKETKDLKAVALSYNEKKDAAPKVSAKGKGYVAEKIIEQARENNVPIQEDPSLIELLSEVEINEQIPEELYEVVAELLSFIYRLDQQR